MTAPLDLLSTSQTRLHEMRWVEPFTGEVFLEPPVLKYQSCPFGAPLIAMVFRGRATIQQTCCNHWECPTCGQTRAKQEYRRVVWGAEVLADEGHALYFWTLTCRGKELSYEDAMEGYYEWTNRLLTSARIKCQRAAQFWAYIQITEHQKKTRAHPHSHLIITFLPSDAVGSVAANRRTSYTSKWFTTANVSSGLGVQCRISRVADAGAVSRYVAKYLFKAGMTDVWPPKWKRIRYSANWPKPPYAKADMAIILRTPEDWRRARETKIEWLCEDGLIFQRALHRMTNISLREGDLTF